MVTTGQEGGENEVDLEQRLSEAWQGMIQTEQQASAAFLASSQKKPLGGELGQVAFFNDKLVST